MQLKTVIIIISIPIRIQFTVTMHLFCTATIDMHCERKLNFLPLGILLRSVSLVDRWNGQVTHTGSLERKITVTSCLYPAVIICWQFARLRLLWLISVVAVSYSSCRWLRQTRHRRNVLFVILNLNQRKLRECDRGQVFNKSDSWPVIISRVS